MLHHKRDLCRCDIQLIVITDSTYHHERTNTDKCIYIYDRSAETLKNIFAAADFCIFSTMDSICGNPSFIAAAYGCVPVMPSQRFYDYGFSYFNKLTLDGNGYTYDPLISKDMMYSLWDGLGVYRHDKKTFDHLVKSTMKKVFSAKESVDAIIKEAEKTVYSFI